MGNPEGTGTGSQGGPPGYVVRPIPADRLVVLDWLTRASRRYPVHGLVEFEVSLARARIEAADPPVTWTGFVVATMARAVAAHPEVNARRVGRRVLYFDRVDIGATVEREVDGAVLLSAFTIEAAGSSPRLAAGMGPAVGVTSLGMCSRGGWAVPIPPLTVIATVGGVVDRAVVRDGQVVVRPMLPMTLSFDHGVVDGGPASRFVETLRELTESAAALPAPPESAPSS